MVSDRRRCRACIYAKWAYNRSGQCKFIWCNHLDATGEKHIVIDGVCKSRKTDGITALTESIAAETVKGWNAK